MCGRFVLTLSPEQIQELLPDYEITCSWNPRYNIAPTQQVAAAIVQNRRIVTALHWGLIPSWGRSPAMGARMINARAESVADKPAYRNAFRHRRCLVLADGFYEWQKKPGGKKAPMLFRLKSHAPFAFAGLWEIGLDAAGCEVHSCTIITTRPNSVVGPVHDRMPVILPRDSYERWVDPGNGDGEQLKDLLVPYPADEMMVHPVSSAVNSPFNDSPDCIKPIQQEQQCSLPL